MVKRSDEVDEIGGLKWPRRFPVPRDFGVAKGSRIVTGKSWPAPDGAVRIATLRGLGQGYANDPAFRAKFEAMHPDLPDFLQAAITVYCDNNE